MKPILKFKDFVNEGKQSYSDFKDEVLISIKKLDAKKHGQIVDAMAKGKKNDRYTDYIFNSWENRWPALKTGKGLLHMDESNGSESINEGKNTGREEIKKLEKSMSDMQDALNDANWRDLEKHAEKAK
jgi:hypothetical protein